MKLKRALGVALACAVMVNCFCLPVTAANTQAEPAAFSIDMQRASGKFSMTVPANKLRRANSSFSLDAGEVVTINASYAPSSASVDFGLIDSDNVFHFVTATNGSVNQGIEIEKRGQYTLAVRNNSSSEIEVSGFVSY